MFNYLWALLLLTSCASTEHVFSEYREAIGKDAITSPRTTIFFLIDGLSVQTLSTAFNKSQVPNLQRYFVGNKTSFHLAHTVFPSLTFPAIASLLTEKTVDQYGIWGNSILSDGDVLNFESPKNFIKLNKMISGQNIFTRLKAKGLRSVSFDYSFSADSDSHIMGDANIAYAVVDKKYDFVDSVLLDSLEELLVKTDADKWPDFIFVHIVGIDFLSHDNGSKSKIVFNYLAELDKKLGKVFKVLDQTELARKRRVVAFLSADHGFDADVSSVINITEVFEKIDRNIKVINEGRFAALFLPSSMQGAEKKILTEKLLKNSWVDVIAYQDGEMVSTSKQSYPYFQQNLSYYFKSAGHPDAVVIPKSGVSFLNTNLGQHGGPTREEVLVPLLMHNVELKNSQEIPALHELLNFL